MKHGYLSRICAPPSRKFVSGLALALVSLAYVVITIHVMAPRYIVNDNIINMNFIIGGYPVDYMGVFFTELLHQAYVMQPAVPWYGLSLYALQVVAVYMWLTLIWRAFRPWWLAAVFGLVIFVYYAIFLIELDYTSTSEMLCVSSLVWACLDVLERRPGYLRYLLTGLVFTLGMLARPQGVIGSFACVLPIAIMAAVYCLRERPLRLELPHLALVIAVFFAPAILNLAADTAYRHLTLTPQQAAYEAINVPRGILHALSPERQGEIINDKALLDSVHWSKDDAQDFFHWRFLDERIYTPAALQTLVKGAPYAQHPLADMAGHMLALLGGWNLLIPLLCSLPLFLLAFRAHPWLAGVGLLLPFYCIGLDAFLTVFLTFRDRTEVPFLACCGFQALIMAGYLATHERTDKGWPRMLLLGVAVVTALIGSAQALPGLWKTGKRNEIHAEFAREQIGILNRGYAGSVVVEKQNALQPEALNPLEPFHYEFHDIDMIWDTFSPYFYQQLQPLGIQHGYQLINALVDNKNAYFLGNGWGAEKVLASYADQSKGAVKKELVYEFHGAYYLELYRFVRENPTKTKQR